MIESLDVGIHRVSERCRLFEAERAAVKTDGGLAVLGDVGKF